MHRPTKGILVFAAGGPQCVRTITRITFLENTQQVI